MNRNYQNMYWLITAKAFIVSTNLELLKKLADKCLGIVVKRYGPTIEEAEVVYVGENMCLLDMEVYDNLEYSHLGEETTSPQQVAKWYANDEGVPQGFIERRQETAEWITKNRDIDFVVWE